MARQCIVIEIVEDTQRLIAEFNDGVAPEIEENQTFFVIFPDDTRDIISTETLRSKFYETRAGVYVETHVTF